MLTWDYVSRGLDAIRENDLVAAQQISQIKWDIYAFHDKPDVKKTKAFHFGRNIIKAQGKTGRDWAIQAAKRYVLMQDLDVPIIFHTLANLLSLNDIACFDHATLGKVTLDLVEALESKDLQKIQSKGQDVASALCLDRDISDDTGLLSLPNQQDPMTIDMGFLSRICQSAHTTSIPNDPDCAQILGDIKKSNLYKGWNFKYLVSADAINLQCAENLEGAIPFARRLLCFIFEVPFILGVYEAITQEDYKNIFYAHNARLALNSARINAPLDSILFQEDLVETVVYLKALTSFKTKPITFGEYFSKIGDMIEIPLKENRQAKDIYMFIKQLKSKLDLMPGETNVNLVALIQKLTEQQRTCLKIPFSPLLSSPTLGVTALNDVICEQTF